MPGWTTTGGLNWIGFLISKYNTSLTLSYNFAYGGATTNASLVAPYTPTVLSLIDQVTEFTNSIASKPSYAPWTSKNTLVGVWMGVNDVGNSYWLSNIDQLLVEIMDSYFGQLQILYNAGVRNYVLLSVPRKSPSLYFHRRVLITYSNQPLPTDAFPRHLCHYCRSGSDH
jgi:hypothetical protein